MKFLGALKLRKFPYWYLIVIPALLYGLGIASNQAVLISNHEKFPVMMNAVMIAKDCDSSDYKPEELEPIPEVACIKGGEMIDLKHSIMGPNSHLKVLSDIFLVGGRSLSIGDMLLDLGEWLFRFSSVLWLALTVRKLASLVN